MEVGSSQKSAGFLGPKHWIGKLGDAARQFRQKHTLSPDAALGKRGEDLAHRYLERSGMKVIARNYRPGGGETEVDIVALDGEIYVFIEVKSRRTAEFGSPDRAIGAEKQKNIIKAARRYAARGSVPWNRVRFDIIAIVLTQPPSIVHHQDVFFEGRAIS